MSRSRTSTTSRRGSASRNSTRLKCVPTATISAAPSRERAGAAMSSGDARRGHRLEGNAELLQLLAGGVALTVGVDEDLRATAQGGVGDRVHVSDDHVRRPASSRSASAPPSTATSTGLKSRTYGADDPEIALVSRPRATTRRGGRGTRCGAAGSRSPPRAAGPPRAGSAACCRRSPAASATRPCCSARASAAPRARRACDRWRRRCRCGKGLAANREPLAVRVRGRGRRRRRRSGERRRGRAAAGRGSGSARTASGRR